MTSAIVNSAKAALTLGEGVIQGNLDGRSVTHWSFKLFIGGTIVGAIAAVAAWAMAMTALAIAGVALAITNGMAAYFINKFGALKSLEGYVEQLTQRVQDLHKVNEEFKEVPKNWKEAIDEGEEKLRKKNDELREVAEKLAATEERLRRLTDVVTDINKETCKLGDEVVKFSAENKTFGDNVSDLEKNVNDLDAINKEIDKAVQESENNTVESGLLFERMGKQVEVMRGLFDLMKNINLDAHQQMQELKDEVDQLQLAVQRYVNADKDVDELEKRFLEMAEKNVKKLKNYEKYKAAYHQILDLKKKGIIHD